MESQFRQPKQVINILCAGRKVLGDFAVIHGCCYDGINDKYLRFRRQPLLDTALIHSP